MKRLLLAVPLLLAGCATVPSEGAVEKAVGTAVAGEMVVQALCALGPIGTGEWSGVISARMIFAARYGALLNQQQRDRYDSLVKATNAACGIMPLFPVEPG